MKKHDTLVTVQREYTADKKAIIFRDILSVEPVSRKQLFVKLIGDQPFYAYPKLSEIPEV